MLDVAGELRQPTVAAPERCHFSPVFIPQSAPLELVVERGGPSLCRTYSFLFSQKFPFRVLRVIWIALRIIHGGVGEFDWWEVYSVFHLAGRRRRERAGRVSQL